MIPRTLSRRLTVLALLALVLVMAVPMAVRGQDDEITIGYVVKMGDDPWFVSETGGAKALAEKMGVKLLVQDVQLDAGLALSTLDTFIGSGVDGIIIVVPDQKIGPAVLQKVADAHIPLISVDDNIKDAAGNQAPFAGFNAPLIGQQVGSAILQQYKERGWDKAEGKVGVINIEFASLSVCTDRTNATTDVWKAAMPDFPADQMIVAPYDGTLNNALDTFSATITAHPEITDWVLYSCNDDGVMGAVRALEQAGVTPDHIIGVGIGAHLACDEWAKGTPTGFSGAIYINAASHGEFALAALVNNIKYGVPLAAYTYAPGVFVTPDNDAILNCKK